MLGEDEIIAKLETLGIEDAAVVASYVIGIVDANGADADLIKEAIEPYVSETADLDGFCASLCEAWMPPKPPHSISFLGPRTSS